MADRETESGDLGRRTARPAPEDKSPIASPAAEAPDTHAGHQYRGRLFRRYLLLILTLVTGALLASGAISVYFSYPDNKAAVASLQHEKARVGAIVVLLLCGLVALQFRL